MIDDYVMDTALGATGVTEILDLYEYACRYELAHLCMRYTKELSNRLSIESFLQVESCYCCLSRMIMSECDAMSKLHDDCLPPRLAPCH
jgi:hypothetical protein